MLEERRHDYKDLDAKLDAYIKANDAYHMRQDEVHKQTSDLIAEMHRALKGDPVNGVSGLINDMKPITEAWKALKWGFGFVLAIGGLLLMIKSLFFRP